MSGVIGLPHQLDFIPVLDVHSGFLSHGGTRTGTTLGQRNRAVAHRRGL